MAVVTVKLYGPLSTFGVEHTFDVQTYREVFSALSSTVKGFTDVFIRDLRYRYGVILNGVEIQNEMLDMQAINGSTMKVVPIVAGGVFLAPIFMYFGATLAVAEAMSISLIVSISLSLIMTGISMLLTEAPREEAQAKQSNNFGVTNISDTIQQGGPVPLAYGKVLCDVFPVSLKVNVVQGER